MSAPIIPRDAGSSTGSLIASPTGSTTASLASPARFGAIPAATRPSGPDGGVEIFSRKRTPVKRTEPKDAAALLAILAAGLILAAANHAHTLSRTPSAFDHALTRALPLLLALAAAVLGLVVIRVVVTRRTLRSRIRLTLVPADTFDPPLDAVTRFASQLTRTRRAIGGWLDPRASAVRVLIATGPDGVVRYALEVPSRARPALEAAAQIYAEVELHEHPLESREEPGDESGRVAVARAELVLARPSSEPLADPSLDPDPLQSLAGVLGSLHPERGEQGAVAVDLLAATGGQRARLRRRLARQARRAHPAVQRPSPLLSGLLDGPASGGGRAAPVDLVERRAQTRGLQAKLGSPQPLFALQVLLRVQSPTTARPPAVLQGLLACFDQLAGENHLRVAGLRVPGAFFGSDLPGHRTWFDRRLESGLFRPARRGWVTATEIAGLLKPPTARCQAANVQRSGGVIPPPPPGLPTFAGQPDLIPLGRVHPGGAEERLVGVRVADTFFSYMAGRSRYGKTETAIGQFVHLARAGHGGLFLDPHADAIAEIKTYLTGPGVRERVVEVNLADRDAEQAQPAWNLLAAHHLPATQAANKVEAIVDALASALRWDERNTRALNLATQSAQALVELARTLPAELAPTVFQLPTLLSDEQWRAAVLPHVSPATRQFFEQRFPRLPAEAVTAVTNLIDRLRAARPVAALFGAPISTYDIRRAMDRGLIVLACPGSGSTRDRLVANFLVYDVLHAAKGRAALPPEHRKPFWVFLDELQTYDGPNLPELLEQSAKYGGRAFLFNQNPERLTDATLNAVTTNRSHLLTTTVNAKAAGLLAREWGGEPTPQTVTQLQRYTYLASVTLGPRASKPFLVHGVAAAELHAAHRHPDQVGELEQAITEHGGRRPVAETLAALDGHDERIRTHLEARECRDATASGERAQPADDGGGRRVRPGAMPARRTGSTS